jgi:hypothetical protein
VRGDLPSVVNRNTVHPDAASRAEPANSDSPDDAASIVLAVETDGSANDAWGTGEIALVVSLPINTTTGQVLSVGSLRLQLWSPDRISSRSLTLELSQAPGTLTVNLDDVAAGGPYTLDAFATPAEGVACAGSSPPFVVLAGATVRVFESLLCDGDGGLTPTLDDPDPTL